MLDLSFDMAAAIDQLADPSRSVVLLSEQGHSLVEVAGIMRLYYKQTICPFADGVKRLRRAGRLSTARLRVNQNQVARLVLDGRRRDEHRGSPIAAPAKHFAAAEALRRPFFQVRLV